jgi:hypothetical protein
MTKPTYTDLMDIRRSFNGPSSSFASLFKKKGKQKNDAKCETNEPRAEGRKGKQSSARVFFFDSNADHDSSEHKKNKIKKRKKKSEPLHE